MKWNLFKNTFYTIPDLLRYGLAGALVLVISIFFPSGAHFNYEFEQGGRWKYEDLMSPFERFPIKKSTEQLEDERDSLSRSFRPYYRLDTSLHSVQKEKFIANFNMTYKVLVSKDSNRTSPFDSALYINFGKDFIDYIYEQHVLGLNLAHLDKDDFSFQVLLGNRDLGEMLPSDYLNPKQVSMILIDTLRVLEDNFPEYKVVLPFLVEAVTVPDLIFDQELTNTYRKQAIENIHEFSGMVKSGDPIVIRNQRITPEVYAKLVSYQEKCKKEMYEADNDFLIYLGYLSLTVALMMIFVIFVKTNAQDVFDNIRHYSLLLLLILAYTYLSKIIYGVPVLSLYLIPFCILPIVVQNFFSAQLALMTHLVTVLLISMLLSLDYQFILVQIIVGMVAILTKLRTRYLSDFFIALLSIGIVYIAGFLSLELIRTWGGGTNTIGDGIEWETLGWVGLNIFLTLLSYPLIPLLERIFGLTSEITLVELSDLNNPLLKELSLRAPGTLQHSLQVANLSEAAASAIGANSLLVKVAALYHDIGKMHNPLCYIENQGGHVHNPHDDLSHLESAQVILAHVTEGIKLAKKHRLPNVLIDFIKTHHGTTRVEYFYRMHQKYHPDEAVDERLFLYEGPRPRSKEEAILMIADSLEAASKSLKSPTGQDIDLLTDNIISSKINMKQLDDTNLSFRELEEIKAVFKKLIRSIRHIRIEYPKDENINDTEEDIHTEEEEGDKTVDLGLATEEQDMEHGEKVELSSQDEEIPEVEITETEIEEEEIVDMEENSDVITPSTESIPDEVEEKENDLGDVDDSSKTSI
ncbi:MAG: HDIG domain-containing protein [Saprospiraceae bacterium]|nr:HDIG domain-containing protein [Saprospiraceae bacterium]